MRRPRRQAGHGLGLLVTATVFAFANHLLLRGRAVGIWDADDQFFPFFTLVADYARLGRLVLWDPWSNGGLPIMGEPQVGAFSPLTVGLGLLTGGGSRGFIAYWLVMWWLGGAGMYLLSRHLRAPRWGSTVIGLAFLFCGVYTANAEHISWVVGFSFLPWIIWRLDAALQERRLAAAAQAGALWGLSGLAGYPGLVIITAGFAALWALGRCAFPHDGRRPARTDSLRHACRPLVRAVLGLLLMAAVGVVVLAPAYFSFFYESAGTHRRIGALDRATALVNQFDPAALITLASPYPARLKVSYQETLFPSSDVSMANVYVGVVVPVLACFALLLAPSRPWRWWVLALAGLALTASMGQSLPVRGWLYDWVYPMRFFRHSAIFRLYFVFAVCVLAALGARDLRAALRSRAGAVRAFVIVSTTVAAAAITAYVLWLSVHAAAVTTISWRPVGLSAPWLAMVGAGWLVGCAPRARGAVPPWMLVLVAAGDALLTSVVARPSMVATGHAVERWQHLDALHAHTLDLGATVGLLRLDSYCISAPGERCKRNDQLITKVPVFRSGTTQANGFHELMVAEPVLRGMATGAGRIWFSRDVVRVAPTPMAFERFRARAIDAGRAPLLVHLPEAVLHGERAGAPTPGTDSAIERLAAVEPVAVQLHEYRPERLRFSVTAPADGWLLVTDRWARSWRATVNGGAVPLHAGNFIFRAVPVREGVNMVDFVYQPRLLPALVLLSWGTLGVVLVFGWRRRVTVSRRSGRRPGLAGLCLIIPVLVACQTPPPATAPPPDWRADWSVAEGLALTVDTEGYRLPTAIAFVPRPGAQPDAPLYFVTELHGRVRVVTNDRRVHDFADGFVRRAAPRELPAPEGETGLAGICLDPARGYVFVTFAYRDDGGALRNDVVRFTTAPHTFSVRHSEQRAFTELFAPYRAAVSHQIGGCQVDGDAVYVGVGDGRQTEQSRNPGSLLGKVLRFSVDGRALPGGPFPSRGAADAAEYVWAIGFRNPFGLKRVGDRLFVVDNGSRIDRFVEVRAGEDFLWAGTDLSLGARADAALHPSIGPAQLEFVPPGAPGIPPSLHDRFVVAASAPERTGVVSLPYGRAERRMRGAPEHLVRYEGPRTQIVAGTALGPDGLYFVPVLPDAAGRSAVYRIRHDPPRAHPYRIGERRNARAIIEETGCLGCHRLGGVGGAAGPPLDHAALAAAVDARLDAPDYRQRVAALDRLDEEPFARYRTARHEVLARRGDARLRTWITYKLLEPRFDNPDAQMPNPRLSQGEAMRVAERLVRVAPARAPLHRRLLSRLSPGQAWRKSLVVTFGAGLVAGAAVALVAVRVHRRWRAVNR